MSLLGQSQLPLRDPRYRRPTMTVDAAKGVLDCTEDDIVAMIDERYALVAWNIATPGANRRELRILTASVSEYLRDNPDHSECYHSMICPSDAISHVLPKHEKPFVTGIEIQRALNCSSTHVIRLIESKSLALVPGSNYQPGPGGSPCITRESFTAFLNTRLAVPVIGKSSV